MKYSKEILKCDVVVIGGGVVGVMTARELTYRGYEVIVLEKGELFNSVKDLPAVLVTVNQGKIYSDVAQRLGNSSAKAYYSAQCEGAEKLVDSVKKSRIDVKEVKAFYYSCTNHVTPEKSYKALLEVGADCYLRNDAESFGNVCSLGTLKNYVFSPQTYFQTLINGFKFIEHTTATYERITHTVTTERYLFKPKYVVFATGDCPKLTGKVTTVDLQISNVFDKRVANAYLSAENGFCLLPIDACNFAVGSNVVSSLGEIFNGRYSVMNTSRAYRSADGLPIVGKLWEKVYAVCAMSRYGIANATVCSGVVADCIEEKQNRYAQLFSPQRKFVCERMLKKIVKLFCK